MTTSVSSSCVLLNNSVNLERYESYHKVNAVQNAKLTAQQLNALTLHLVLLLEKVSRFLKENAALSVSLIVVLGFHVYFQTAALSSA